MSVAAFLAPLMAAAGNKSHQNTTAAEAGPLAFSRCGFDELSARFVANGTSGIAYEAGSNTAATRDGEAVVAQLQEYRSIRITISSFDLTNANSYCSRPGELRRDFKGGSAYCTQDDILTRERQRILSSYLIPESVRLHIERLNVRPMTQNIVVNAMSRVGPCSQFIVPADHQREGLELTDFVLYVAAGPTPATMVAFAMGCMFLSGTGRPIVGVSNYAPRSIEPTRERARVMAHELLHALGFSSSTFSSMGILSRRINIRGKPHPQLTLSSPRLLAAARAHYRCSSMEFVELEDEGGLGTAGSHWERRNAKDEIMAGISNYGYYTAMTLAVMEDLGYYTANYHLAEVMPWGRSAGCPFLNEKCIEGGITRYPSAFCTERRPYPVCTSDRAAMGPCELRVYRNALPPHFRYFANPAVGGEYGSCMDYCPSVSVFVGMNCVDGDPNRMSGSLVNSEARCFDTSGVNVALNVHSTGSVSAICATVRCDQCRYSIHVRGARRFAWCPAGTIISLPELSPLFKSGTLICPPFHEVCTDYANPHSQMGYLTSFCGA